MRAAHPLQQFAAADPRQHQVEDQQIVRVGVNELLTLAAVRCKVHRTALGTQAAGDEFRELTVILNDQHSQMLLPRRQLKQDLTGNTVSLRPGNPHLRSRHRHRNEILPSYACHGAATHYTRSPLPRRASGYRGAPAPTLSGAPNWGAMSHH